MKPFWSTKNVNDKMKSEKFSEPTDFEIYVSTLYSTLPHNLIKT